MHPMRLSLRSTFQRLIGLLGQYDLMMKRYLDDDVDIVYFVTEKTHRLSSVKGTFTIIVFNWVGSIFGSDSAEFFGEQ